MHFANRPLHSERNWTDVRTHMSAHGLPTDVWARAAVYGSRITKSPHPFRALGGNPPRDAVDKRLRFMRLLWTDILLLRSKQTCGRGN